jgi:hypothetical protein
MATIGTTAGSSGFALVALLSGVIERTAAA